MNDLQGKLKELGIEILQGSIDRSGYYSVKEAAEILGVTTKTIRNRIEKKELLAVFHDIGIGQSQYLIPKTEIDVTIETSEIVSISRAVSVPELKQLIKAQLQEENETIRAEMAEIRTAQTRLEQSLKERDERLLQAIRDRQEERQEEQEHTNKSWWQWWK